MRLDALTSLKMPSADAAVQVRGLACDSRAVRDGFLFAALSGMRDDGALYVGDALARGARAILTDERQAIGSDVAQIIAPQNMGGARYELARMAAAFFVYQPSHIAAVTGTNGKSSVVRFLSLLLAQQGHMSAAMGTLGVEIIGDAPPVHNIATDGLTTPDSIALHACLRALYAARVTHLALEASSHGLAQGRLEGVRLRAAGFTNLSRDHLDYHATMEDYFTAKSRLFTDILPRDGVAVIDIASEAGREMAARARASGREVLSVGTPASGVYVELKVADSRGLQIVIYAQGQKFETRFPVFGAFQCKNLQLALGLLLALDGASDGMFESALEGIAGVDSVKGRMQLAGAMQNGAQVFVDYAHTPDALQNALAGLQAHIEGAIWLVFGCGGERDRGKRAAMGAVAAQYATHVIVTDDNPRHEDPAMIRAEIMAACENAEEVAMRGAAIEAALMGARKGDAVLVAGKGHEAVQIIGDVAHAFDDAAYIVHFLAKREASA